MPKEKASSKKKGKPSEKKKAVIEGYGRLYEADLTGEELDCIIEDAFSNPDISSETKRKVKKKLKEKKGKKD